ncbi:hypothetical protein [Streptomyces sp. NPDC002588]|uniref:hypothetical protein n=1 Tax=Streptomyces sp. NPDC002588 TaxID=3154419 RepID=UPI00331A5FF1
MAGCGPRVSAWFRSGSSTGQAGVVLPGLGQGIAWTATFVAAGTGVDAHHQGLASAVGLVILVAVAVADSGVHTTT